MKKNEEKFTIKFNTCLLLIKDIESVIKSATTSWKNIYNLHQPSDFLVHVSDKYNEGDKEDDEKDDNEDVETEDANLDDKEEGQEAIEENLPKI